MLAGRLLGASTFVPLYLPSPSIAPAQPRSQSKPLKMQEDQVSPCPKPASGFLPHREAKLTSLQGPPRPHTVSLTHQPFLWTLLPPRLQPRPLALLPLPPHCSLTSGHTLALGLWLLHLPGVFPQDLLMPGYLTPFKSLLKWHLFSEASPDGPRTPSVPPGSVFCISKPPPTLLCTSLIYHVYCPSPQPKCKQGFLCFVH